MIFKITDDKNIPVVLSKDTWYKKLLDPVFGHPEVKPFLTQIKSVIKNPDYVYQSTYDHRSKIAVGKIINGEFTSYFLAVVIKYVKEQGKVTGYVSTVMINRRLPKTSKLLWERKVLI